MWVLLFIAFGLQSIGGPVVVKPLPKSDEQPFYETFEECDVERARIEGDMHASYPNEVPDYKLECKKVPKKTI
jgi:hypothetical protein